MSGSLKEPARSGTVNPRFRGTYETVTDKAAGQRRDPKSEYRHACRMLALRPDPADVGGEHGIPDVRGLDQAFEVARTFKPLTESQLSALLARTRSAALSGKYEGFKTSTQFDGTAHNPQWMA